MTLPTGSDYWKMVGQRADIDNAQRTANKALKIAEETKKRLVIDVAGKKVEFSHTAVNKDMHLFINDYHNPDVCPECIQPGILVEKSDA